MTEALHFLAQYGYLILFVWILLDQVGLPIPSIPLLLGAGALAGTGRLDLAGIAIVALAASLPMDLLWFYLGRKRGGRVLNLLCAISFEPDYCVRNTEATFRRYGLLAIVVAKFVPGLQTIAPPMAGMTGVPVLRFVVLDAIAVLLFVFVFALPAAYFHQEVEVLAARVAELGHWAGVGVGAIVTSYVGGKFLQRRLFLRSLRMRRLLPDELNAMISEDRDVHVIDLRHQYDVDVVPHQIPGARHIPMEFIDEFEASIPRDRDIILYCS